MNIRFRVGLNLLIGPQKTAERLLRNTENNSKLKPQYNVSPVGQAGVQRHLAAVTLAKRFDNQRKTATAQHTPDSYQ